MRRARAEYREGAATPLSYFLVQHGPGTVRRTTRLHTTRLRTASPIAFCLLWPALALAQVTATSEYVARMDADGDDRVSLEEYQAWMGYAFERMDANRDGLLTADELPGGEGETISLAEHRESLAAMFRRQDADGDGFLSANELAAPPR